MERLPYMAGDAMRARLLEVRGYEVDIVELVYSRATDKNTLVRARRRNRSANPMHTEALALLMASFETLPALAHYLGHVTPAGVTFRPLHPPGSAACSCERHDVAQASAS